MSEPKVMLVNPTPSKPKRRRKRKNPVKAKVTRRKRKNPTRRYKEKTQEAGVGLLAASAGGVFGGVAAEQLERWVPADGKARWWGGALMAWAATAGLRLARLSNAPEMRDALAGAAGATADRATQTARYWMASQKAAEVAGAVGASRLAPRRLLRAKAAARDAGELYGQRLIGDHVGPRRLQVAGNLQGGLDVHPPHPRRLQVAGNLQTGLDVHPSGYDIAASR